MTFPCAVLARSHTVDTFRVLDTIEGSGSAASHCARLLIVPSLFAQIFSRVFLCCDLLVLSTRRAALLYTFPMQAGST